MRGSTVIHINYSVHYYKCIATRSLYNLMFTLIIIFIFQAVQDRSLHLLIDSYLQFAPRYVIQWQLLIVNSTYHSGQIHVM